MYAVLGEQDLVFTIDFPDADLLLHGTLELWHFCTIEM